MRNCDFIVNCVVHLAVTKDICRITAVVKVETDLFASKD